MYDNQRGNIYASDGTLLAQSVRSASASPFLYLRKYPQGSLYSQVVGYASPFYGTAGIENQYNQQLTRHTLPAQTLSQALGFEPLQSSIDNLTLTIDPHLQETAESALNQITGTNKDAAVLPSIPPLVRSWPTTPLRPSIRTPWLRQTSTRARRRIRRTSTRRTPRASPGRPVGNWPNVLSRDPRSRS